MKAQINFRASDLTERQLTALEERWGTSRTETLTIVIDRVFREESNMDYQKLLSGEMEPDTSYPTTGQTWYIENGSEPYTDLGRVPGKPGVHVLHAQDGSRLIIGGYNLRREGEVWSDFLSDTDDGPAA